MKPNTVHIESYIKHSLIAFHLIWDDVVEFQFVLLVVSKVRDWFGVKNAHLWNGDSSCQKLRGAKMTTQ